MKRFVLPRFDAVWHFHPEIELTLIQESSGQRFVGDSIESFDAGDLVMIGPNLPHYWKSSVDKKGKGRRARAVVLQFRADFLGEEWWEFPEMRSIAGLLRRAQRGIRFRGSFVSEVEGQLEALLDQKGGRLLGGLLELLEDLSRTRRYDVLSSEGFLPTLDTSTRDRINRCHDYVFRNFREEITLAGAARAVGMSEQAWSRYFKSVTGNTFSRFVNEVRIGHACRLLVETDLSIAEIAYECGYGSLSNFNRRFLELRGSSPKIFRETMRGC